MFNLYQILTGAQGGQALDNLAERFGLSRQQADTAVQALIPALSTAFVTKAMHPGGMQEIAGAMTDDDHRQAYADPDVAHAPQTQQKSGDLAASMFGNSGMVQTVVRGGARGPGRPAPYGCRPGSRPSPGSTAGGGMFGSILGSIFGGGQATQPPASNEAEAPSQQHSGGFPGADGFSGLQDIFGKMFQPGVETPPSMGGNLADQIGSILSGKRG